ncbi:MAG: hypothetical protein [Myoviridae sp. ctThM1]|nr:MAG: hypothetical protein [Myoviridae sp. ctThM1]
MCCRNNLIVNLSRKQEVYVKLFVFLLIITNSFAKFTPQRFCIPISEESNILLCVLADYRISPLMKYMVFTIYKQTEFAFIVNKPFSFHFISPLLLRASVFV